MIELNETEITKWKAHVLDCYPNEACSIVKDNKIIITDNISEKPDMSFEICQRDIIKHTPDGIIHSHTYDIAEKSRFPFKQPSYQDFITQQEMNIPWGISSTEGDIVSELSWWPRSRNEELYNRRFLFYIYDCYTLLRDYYHQKLNIELPEYPENFDITDIRKDAYWDNIEKFGFYKIALSEVREHDVLLLSFKRRCDHSAIYLGDNRILNHMAMSISREYTMGKLASFLTCAARWKGFE